MHHVKRSQVIHTGANSAESRLGNPNTGGYITDSRATKGICEFEGDIAGTLTVPTSHAVCQDGQL
jgi:hypothetical protein